jgi:hypothetical protein
MIFGFLVSCLSGYYLINSRVQVKPRKSYKQGALVSKLKEAKSVKGVTLTLTG